MLAIKRCGNIWDKDLEALLYSGDSAYKADTQMRKGVQKAESERKRKLELLLQTQEKQQETEELIRKAGSMNR